MSTQSAKKRLGSRRRGAKQNEISKNDEFHVTDNTFVAECDIPEENTESLNVLAKPDNSTTEIQPPPSPELSSNRRKLGSRRRNKLLPFEDSATESYHEPIEEVEEKTRVKETTVTKQMSLAIQSEKQEVFIQGTDHESTTHEDYFYLAATPKVQYATTKNCPNADLESLIPKIENLQADLDDNESVLSCPGVDQQLIDQLNFRQMPEEKRSNVHSVTEKECKKRDNNTELLRKDGNLQGNYLVSESHVESVAMHFSTTPEITTEKISPRENTEIEQATISSPKEEFPTDEKKNQHSNLFEVKCAHRSEDAVNNVHEQEVKPTQIKEMPQIDDSSESVIHDATGNSKIISGNLTDKTEVSDTYQSELIVKRTDEFPINQDISISDDKQDEHSKKESNFEAVEQKNKAYYVSDTENPQISNIEGVDTALGQVYETEGRVQDETKPSAEHTGHQEKEGLFSEMEESEFSLQALQSEINAPFDSQPQHNDINLNSFGNRRKLGSSRKNKGRQRVKDSVAESYHKPAEEVVGDTMDNEPLETTEMSLSVETAVKEKSMETMLEEMDQFDIAQTEDVCDQVKENALVGGDLHSSLTVDQQMIDQSNSTEMPEEELSNVCFVKEENKEGDDDTELFRQDGHLQTHYLVSESCVKSEDIDYSNTPEITTDKHNSKEHTEPQCSVEQAICLSTKRELPTNDGQIEILNLSEDKGAHQSEDSLNELHEQEITPTEMHEVPQIDDLSESVKDDATDNSEIISGNLADQTEVSDTYQCELIVKSTDYSPTNQELSIPDKHDNHPTKENNFEASEQKNKDCHVYGTKKPQISDIERLDTVLDQVYEIEDQVEADIKPGAEHTGHQEKGLFSEMEESEFSLQALQSEINAPFDSQPQHNDTSLNSFGNRRKLGSSRKNKGRQLVKDSVAESYNVHKKDMESTRDIEAFQTGQIQSSQRSESYIKPATHDSSLYTAYMPGYSSDVQGPTTTSYPEADLESLNNKSENPQDDHDERGNDFKVEVSDKSVGSTLEGTDQSDTLQSQELTGAHNLEDAVNTVHKQEVKPTEMQEMPQIDFASESVIHDATENSEIISGNLADQTEVSDTYQCELIVKRTGDSPTSQKISNSDKQDEHPTKENNFESLERKNEDCHFYDINEPQISHIERVYTAPGQVYETEGRVQDETKPSAEHTGHQEKEGLFSEMEESESSLQTLQSEINAPFNSQPQHSDTGFNPIGNRRKLGSSRKNKGRQHVKDSVAESYHEPAEEVVGDTRDNEPLETTEMSLSVETAVKEKSMETMLEEMDQFDTAQTEDVCDQVKENAIVGGDLHSSLTVDQQMIDQSNSTEMPEEELSNMCFVKEENKEGDDDTELFRQDGHLQIHYLVSESCVKSEDIDYSNTPEITTDKHNSKEHTEPQCSVEQAICLSTKRESPTNDGQTEILNLSEDKGAHQSEDSLNELHEQEITPTEMHEVPQIDDLSESVIHDATENSEIISGNLAVSDTYQCELIVKRTGDSPTSQKISNSDKQDEHPTKENNFESLERKNEDCHIYDIKEPQISHIERVYTALGQVYETEGRVQDETKPSAEHTGHQEKEGLFSEMEESEFSLQALQSEINAPFDSQPQHNDTSLNSFGNRRKLGSSRKNKGRQLVKDSVAESYNVHKKDMESTRDIEAFQTGQIQSSQRSESYIKPATHDSSLYTAYMPGYSSDVQGPTTTNYPEADLESLNNKSENPQDDHDERENDFKVEVSDKSVGSTLEGTDQSDTLQSQELTGAHNLEDAVNTVHKQEVKPTEMQEMPQIDFTSESVIHDATENSEIISGNLADQTEVSDTYQCELIVKRTGDSPTSQKISNSDKQDEHPTKENNFESLERKNEDCHIYDIKEPQISHIERVYTAPGQVYETEGRVQDETKPSAEHTGHQEKEGLFSEMEESESALQTLQSEINAPFDSQPQHNDISLNSFGNRRKLGSSRKNKGRQHVKVSVAESYHEPAEEVVGDTRDNEPLETTEMSSSVETAVNEREHTEPQCNVEQAILLSPKEELSTSEEQKEHVNLSQVRGARHSEDAVNEVHEEEGKPTQMHQTDNFSVKESLQTLHSEMNAPLDSQPFDSYQSIKGQTPTGFNPTGNRRKFGSNRKNKGLQVKDTTKIPLVTETMRQEELKEQTNLDFKPAGEIRQFRSTVNAEDKMSEEGTILSQNVMDSSTIVTIDIPSSSGKDDFVKSKEDNETENKLRKETENLSQLTGCDTVKMDLIQSPNISIWKDDSAIQNISYHDENVTTRPIAEDVLEQEGAFQVHDTEALSCDKEINMQQTNDTSQIVGDVTIKAYNSGAESSMCVQVSRQDKDGKQFEDPTKKDHEAQEMNVSQVITHAELFSVSQNKTDTLAPFDIGLEENIQAEPAGDVSEESGISSQQRIQEKTNLDDGENLQGRSKQKRRKMGSTRRTQLNRKPEEKRGETKESGFNTEADMRNVDKMEAVEDLQMIVTAEVLQNEHAKPSLSPKNKEQHETVDYSNTVLTELSASHNKEVVNPVKFVHVSDVRDSESNVDVSVEPSQLDDFTTTEMHITSVLAGRNSINPLLSANTEDTTNTGITGGSFVSLCETTQSAQIDEKWPESVNVINEQALKSADEPVVADLETGKSVVRGGAEEEHVSAQASKQEPDEANEGAHTKNLEMKNANLDSTNKRRKMGSTRKSLASRTKREDLYEKQEEDNEATEVANIVGVVKTESFSGNIGVLQLHKDSGSEQNKEKEFETSESYFKPHQTFEENPVSHGQLVETEHQLTPSYLPAILSTSPKHDLMSESASSRKRRKMGSHRKSHGHQNNENQTAREDKITDAQNGRDVRSITDESANKTTEELREESLGPDKISEVNKSDKKPSSNISTSKALEQPVSEKKPKEVTPVQHPYAEIRLAQESQQKFSLGNSRAADLQSNTYNVIMVGDSSVGKTSFMKRAQSGKFSLDLPASVGLDSCMWTVVVDGKHVVLQLWDTAGQERFHSMTRQIFHKANAFLLMYDITSSQSFSAVSYWASCIQEGAAENVTILLVGNKSDLAERQVKTQEVEVLAKEYNFEFMECSAATGENVVESLETVARMLSQKVDTREEAMELHKEPNKKKSSGCC
ncbi:uncharacterized protein rab44 isoform X2 [Perca flavescens]|uniref:uncharacterized protein rab44 isoform X2 n=1 Tax=Perca flavescens TaxID=8167 RepID=UPI00106F09B9|nr:uncharacterized protein LOC114554174 isoform X2 [Perca flavescens]